MVVKINDKMLLCDILYKKSKHFKCGYAFNLIKRSGKINIVKDEKSGLYYSIKTKELISGG